MADCIVATEVMGFNLIQKVCKGTPPPKPTQITDATCPPITPVHPVQRKSSEAVNKHGTQSTKIITHLIQKIVLSASSAMAANNNLWWNPLSDLTEMVDLCIKMVKMMGSMATNMESIATDSMKAVDGMADRIMTTMGLIGKMADQINDMGKRIVETEKLMANLVANCA